MDSSRIGLLGRGCILVILAAGAGCSSSSSPPSAGPEADGSTTITPTVDGGKAAVDGGGMPCTKTYPIKVATYITATVSWPASAAVAKGSGPYYLWLLTTYSADASNKITGTTQTCGTAPAILTLSSLGNMAEGVPMGTNGQVKPTYPTDAWDGVPLTNITGTLGGTNVGSSFETDPSLSLQGLKPSDPLSDPTKPWPPSQSSLPAADLTYADGGAYVMGQGHPGVHGIFDVMSPYYPSTTSLATDSPRADQFWTVNRVQLSLYGKSTSCSETTGAADVTLINNRVVGCEIVDGGGPCTMDQYGFLDSNTTQYTPTTGTFDAKELPATGSCSDVLTMFPQPM